MMTRAPGFLSSAAQPRLAAVALLLVAAAACSNPGPVAPTVPPAPSFGGAELGAMPPHERYDGNVASVDLIGQSFTLDDATVVTIDASTKWKSGGNRLTSLAAMGDALAGGFIIRAKGKADDDGGTLVAQDVDAKVEEQDALDEFDDMAVAADGGLGTIDLMDGTVVSTNAATTWKSGPDRLGSAQEVADALAGGIGVRVKGRGTVQPDSSILASRLDVRIKESSTGNFRGVAAAVDEIAGTILLDDGTTIAVFGGTDWKHGPKRLTSLADLAAALAGGTTVKVRGKGVEQPDGSMLASELDVRVDQASLSRFRGVAVAADAVAGTVELDDGTVVAVFDGTQWKSGGKWLSDLVEIEIALAALETVSVAGRGTAQPDGSILATRIRARLKP